MSLPQIVDVLLRRQRNTFLVVFLAAFGAVLLVTFTLPKEYEATSRLFVGDNRPLAAGADAVQLDEVLAETYAALLDTPGITNEVAEALPFEMTRGEVGRAVDFKVVTGTKLIEIGALDGDPERARIIANTFADTFVTNQRRAARAASKENLDELSTTIGELAEKVAALKAQGAAGSAGALAQAEVSLEAARESFSGAQQNSAVQGQNVAVSARAETPGVPAKPRPKLYAAVGFVFALVLALVAALLRNTFDKRLRDEQELVDLVGAPVLARVPLRRSSANGVQLYNESFQFLRANLQLQGGPAAARLLAVTSSLPGEGKSTVVTGMATAMALSGAEVIAIDCDLRKPRLATYFEVDGSQGVTNVLVGSRVPSEVLVNTTKAGVQLVPSGPVPPNPSVLLNTPSFRQLLGDMRAEADHVVVDTPPVTAGADTSVIMEAVNGVVLVVDMQRSRRDAIIATRDQLAKSDVPLIGVVLNRVPESQAGYGYYGQEGDDAGFEPSVTNGSVKPTDSGRRSPA